MTNKLISFFSAELRVTKNLKFEIHYSIFNSFLPIAYCPLPIAYSFPTSLP